MMANDSLPGDTDGIVGSEPIVTQRADDSVPRFPSHLQIQTTNSCRTVCRFCPNGYGERPKGGRMEEPLYRLIVDECSRYTPRYVALYLMADPLTDRTIERRVAVLRESCPNTHIELSTTPELITPKRAESLLVSGLSELRVSFPSVDAATYERLMIGGRYQTALKNVLELAAQRRSFRAELPRVVVVLLRGLTDNAAYESSLNFWLDRGLDVLSWPIVSRAGNVPGMSRVRHQALASCSQGRATHWMHIYVDGDVGLCCMDYGRRIRIGNVRAAGLAAVWRSSAYRELREMIAGLQAASSDLPCWWCEWNGSWQSRTELHGADAGDHR